MKHVVMFSGGVGSWMAAKRVAAEHGTDDLILLFCDTTIEDPDLYRFIGETAENVGGEFITLKDGRDPWDVFRDVRYQGNSRIAQCSRILKSEIADRWLAELAGQPIVYLGIDWTEEHRLPRAQSRMAPIVVEAPLCSPPYMTKAQMIDALKAEDIDPPMLYRYGFAHNNCGGFCVRAGQAQFELLLRTHPDRYAYHERREQELHAYLGKRTPSLRMVTDGVMAYLTLQEFREHLEAKKQIDIFDWGGCGCFVDDG